MATNDPESILEELAEEFIECIRAGENPSVAMYAQRHPSLSSDISDLLTSIKLMEQLSESESDSREQAHAARAFAPAFEKLGDFDVLREIGRGGMGVVYEAVDRTLQRRVALKVLNDSALTTQKHIDRFRRESQLAAQLHHTNIVSVFGVGEQDRKHFYAMQYIEGVSVQDILTGLEQLPKDSTNDFDLDDWSRVSGLDVAAALRCGQFAEARKTHNNVKQYSDGSAAVSGAKLVTANSSSSPSSVFDQTTNLSNSGGSYGELDVSPEASEQSQADKSAEQPATLATNGNHVPANFGKAYWRSVARMGIQVADALHYAHVNGILHRDIKPANLLFDSNGTVWVADFGLAKLTETDDLTKTGDVVGTLKYMAPEQLAGNADARTDIYGLGLTLYELLTLQPACDGETYKTLFAQKQDPAQMAPRLVNAAIPRDLETIVQKSLEWEPTKRYDSAREMSDDLQRFLDDRPILARRITLPERAWRWCRRNRALATLGGMAAGLFILLPIVLGWAYMLQAQQNQRMENTLDVVLGGFDELFGSYLENDVATVSALSSSTGDETAQLAPAMLTKDTAVVLEKMLGVYDRLAEENASSKDLRLAVESAKARRRVGDLYQQLGQFDKATDSYEDAAARYRDLSKRDAIHTIDVARVHHSKGALLEQTQRLKLARTEYENAIKALGRAPQNAETQFELARTHYLLGKQRLLEGGGPAFGMGPPPQGDFRQGPPDHVRGQRGPIPLGNAQNRLPLGPNDLAERQTHLDTAVELLGTLQAQDGDEPDHQFLLALCLREKERGTATTSQSESRATKLLEELVDRFPNVPKYRFELCESYRWAGHGQINIHGDEGLQKLHLAQRLGEQLVEEQRDAAPYRINLAHIYAFLGIAYGDRGDIKHAEEFTRLSIATHTSVVDDFPGLAPMSDRLSIHDRSRLGRWLLQLRRYEELIDLLSPLCERLYAKLDANPQDNPLPNAERARESRQVTMSNLFECGELAMRAYESLNDDVGYMVALSWLDRAGEQQPGGRDSHGPPPGGPGRGGPGPDGTGPRPEGPNRGPGRGSLGPGGPDIGGRPAGPIEMANSYDTNGDDRITRDEVPSRMAREWFNRCDADSDGAIDQTEIESYLLH